MSDRKNLMPTTEQEELFQHYLKIIANQPTTESSSQAPRNVITELLTLDGILHEHAQGDYKTVLSMILNLVDSIIQNMQIDVAQRHDALAQQLLTEIQNIEVSRVNEPSRKENLLNRLIPNLITIIETQKEQWGQFHEKAFQLKSVLKKILLLHSQATPVSDDSL